MEVITKTENDVNVFKLKGRLDSNTSQGFEEQLFQAIDNGAARILVDFEELDYISSAGLRVILKATKTLNRTEGKIILSAMQDYVKEVFEIAGFDSFLTIVPSTEEALKTF
jgi:anti-sigma B factor antagonist